MIMVGLAACVRLVNFLPFTVNTHPHTCVSNFFFVFIHFLPPMCDVVFFHFYFSRYFYAVHVFGAVKISQGRAASRSYAYERVAAAAAAVGWTGRTTLGSDTATRVITCLYADIYISYHFPPSWHKSSGHSLNNFLFLSLLFILLLSFLPRRFHDLFTIRPRSTTTWPLPTHRTVVSSSCPFSPIDPPTTLALHAD